MVLGDLLDETGRVIDNVLCVRFPAPHSYTGEDCAELHCHGSPIVLDAGLRALLAAYCRRPVPGSSPSGRSSTAGWISSRRRAWWISLTRRRRSRRTTPCASWMAH